MSLYPWIWIAARGKETAHCFLLLDGEPSKHALCGISRVGQETFPASKQPHCPTCRVRLLDYIDPPNIEFD